MTWYQIAAAMTSLVVLAYGWIFTRILSDQKEIEQNLAAHQKATQEKFDQIPDRYVRRDDFADFKTEILAALHRIESKIDSKADRQ